MHIRFSVPFLLGIATAVAHAQAIPAGTVPGDIQVGLGYVDSTPDYGPKNISGFGIFADADLWQHVGIEGEFHRVSGNSPIAVTQSTYEIGARYRYPIRAFSPYIKLLGGGGLFSFGGSSQNGTYAMYAGGGGLDYRVLEHVVARADYEFQRWGSFPPRGLQPSLFTVGVAYRFR